MSSMCSGSSTPRSEGSVSHHNRLILLTAVCSLLCANARAATLHSTTANFASTFSSAQGGDTILLAAGNYGSFSGGSKASMVTISPDTAAGGTQSNVVFGSLNFGSAQNITMQGMTIGGGTVGSGSTAALHIHLVGNKFTDALCINTPTNVNQDTVVDGNSFINIGQSCTEGRIGVTGNNVNHTVVNGVVIKNNLLQGSGPSDGIQINGGAYGTVIGPGNEFVGIKESGCGTVHCDPIQFYGAVNTTITGNFFHGNSTGLMSSSSNGTPVAITNNVFLTDGEYPDQIVQEGGHNDVIRHNTFAGGARIRFGNPNGTGLSSNETVVDNIITGGLNLTDGQTSTTFTMSNNMGPGSLGANSLNATPIYTGGTTPSTWSGFKLASNSPGVGRASDGTDIGITVGGTPPPPPPSGSACDVNKDNTTNIVDVQQCVNQSLGVATCTADINKDGICNVVDVQRVVNAALGGQCVTQ